MKKKIVIVGVVGLILGTSIYMDNLYSKGELTDSDSISIYVQEAEGTDEYTPYGFGKKV